jgi:hypothetical protein
MDFFKVYAKSLIAAAVAFFGTLGVAYTDNTITSSEWLGIAIATLAALGIVYKVPNATDGTAGDGDVPVQDIPDTPVDPGPIIIIDGQEDTDVTPPPPDIVMDPADVPPGPGDVVPDPNADPVILDPPSDPAVQDA